MRYKNNLYHKFVFEKLATFNVIISDRDLSKMHTLAKQQSYLSVDDYLINLIESYYEIIDANAIVNVKNPSEKYDKSVHDLKVHQLVHPKLFLTKNDIADDEQITLDKYIK